MILTHKLHYRGLILGQLFVHVVLALASNDLSCARSGVYVVSLVGVKGHANEFVLTRLVRCY